MSEIQVTTFEEFLTACATSGAEVVCPERAVWDMNQIAPAGAPTVTVACAKIIGNGTTIAKPSIISRSLFNFTNGATVTKLNVADFTADTSVITGSARGAIWKQSEFNGVQNTGAMVSTNGLTFCEDETAEAPLGCGFTVHLAGGCFFSYSTGSTLSLRNCKGKFTGGGALDPKSGSRYNYLTLRYCFLEGDFTQISLSSYCGMSLINSPAKRGVYAGAQAQGAPWVDCTEEQLQDAEYLTSIGFTCGRR
jgi:hypothetical protein